MGSTTLFNPVFIRPEQVVRFLLCTSEATSGCLCHWLLPQVVWLCAPLGLIRKHCCGSIMLSVYVCVSLLACPGCLSPCCENKFASLNAKIFPTIPWCYDVWCFSQKFFLVCLQLEYMTKLDRKQCFPVCQHLAEKRDKALFGNNVSRKNVSILPSAGIHDQTLIGNNIPPNDTHCQLISRCIFYRIIPITMR